MGCRLATFLIIVKTLVCTRAIKGFYYDERLCRRAKVLVDRVENLERWLESLERLCENLGGLEMGRESGRGASRRVVSLARGRAAHNFSAQTWQKTWHKTRNQRPSALPAITAVMRNIASWAQVSPGSPPCPPCPPKAASSGVMSTLALSAWVAGSSLKMVLPSLTVSVTLISAMALGATAVGSCVMSKP